MRHILLAMFMVSAACASTGSSSSVNRPVTSGLDDIVDAAPEFNDVLYTGDFVRIIEFNLPPGSELPAHEGRRRLVYSLTDYVVEWREGDGPLEEKAWSAGDVHVHEALAHRVRNIGETAAVFLVVERLDSELPATEAINPHQGGPDVAFASEHFRVRRVRLDPGESLDSHAGTYRAIYSLSDYELLWETKGTAETKSWRTGDAHWHGPDEHAASNVGATVAEWIVIEILQ
ncbi:MAG TPA: hypothetical protein RMF84_14620 [Polyangiaceae bacterium LLY-WYZ-14_1]|nr:hypothetical protein [Polyangiaceae bacterium LLY-WYZ-14_1]